MNARQQQSSVEGDILEREVSADAGTLAILSKAEIDMQIATAHRFPRSVTSFRKEAEELVTLTEDVATECIYVLNRKDRDGNVVRIEGPSSRFAEVIAHSWGNCRAGARVVDEGAEFITAQGVFHDLQKNVYVAYEVKRRITSSSGRRYSADMIGVTANAACSIALRNAVLKGVPKALWSSIYEAAKKTIIGDYTTLSERRQKVLEAFKVLGVPADRIFEKLGIKGVDDITIDHVFDLRGIFSAIREGDTTVEEAFPKTASAPEPTARSGAAALKTGLGVGKGPEKKEETTGGDTGKSGDVGAAVEKLAVEPTTKEAETPKADPAKEEKGPEGGKAGRKRPSGAPGAPEGTGTAPKAAAAPGASSGSSSAPSGKPLGTPEEKAKILAGIKAAADADKLAEVADGANLSEWSSEDMTEINGAYLGRLEELEP